MIENQESSPRRTPSQFGPTMSLGVATLWGVYLCADIISPFVTTLTWALALSLITHPLYTRIQRAVTQRSTAALIATTMGALLLLIPSYWVASILITTTVEHAASLLDRSFTDSWIDLSQVPPHLAKILHWAEESLHIQMIINDLIRTFAQRLPKLLTISLVGALQMALVLFTTFFFIRDGRYFLSEAKRILPFPPEHIDTTVLRVVDTVHATLFGILLMSILQGFLGGAIFWWLDLPRAALWGTIMGLLAILPYLGAFVVWVPAAIALALDAEWNKALLLTFWGMIVIGLSDNLLYPILVGRRIHYHTLVIFFFLCGGLISFGGAGVVLGPVILALTHSLLSAWKAGAPLTDRKISVNEEVMHPPHAGR
jgi:predicted PurR-regulated permease PerM